MPKIDISTDDRKLTVFATTEYSRFEHRFLMANDIKIDSKLRKLLLKITLKHPSPIVYIGGIKTPIKTEEVEDESVYQGPPEEPQYEIGEWEDFDEVSEEGENPSNDIPDEEIEFFTHPPESIIPLVEEHGFIYSGVHADSTGIAPNRLSVADLDHVFGSEPEKIPNFPEEYRSKPQS